MTLVITLKDIRIEHLHHIKCNYWYSEFNGVKNIFVVKLDMFGRKIIEIEPACLKTMLEDLSDKVPYGNNYVSVAEHLRIPFVYEAIELDKTFCRAFSKN